MRPQCPYCIRCPNSDRTSTDVRRHGHFRRSSDGALIARFKCSCRRTFSVATFDRCFRQKKRHINQQVAEQLVSGVSQRRCAFLLRVNKNTIVRKFIFLGQVAHKLLIAQNAASPKSQVIEFDDLETFIHTKLKPVSVTLAVEAKTRKILDFQVSTMPAKGRLAKISVQKYGKRRDHRPLARKRLFKNIQSFIEPHSIIKSDMNPHYVNDVKVHFPQAKHVVFKGRKPVATGLGELKGPHDPLFTLNHTFAMKRANINRLIRETWCTSKKKIRLEYHLSLYALFHNNKIITGKVKKKLAHQI